jgi:hypothetical protein
MNYLALLYEKGMYSLQRGVKTIIVMVDMTAPTLMVVGKTVEKS